MTSIESAYQYCERMAKSHYENFPVGSLLIPKKKRPYIWSIYAFARSADDFADESYPSRKNFPGFKNWETAIQQGESARLEKLQTWEHELQLCYHAQPTHPIFVALARTIRDLNIPQKLLSDLLFAFKQDVTKRRYENWEEVLFYCQHSANPVGRLVLWVFGYRDEKLFELSDAICTGLQLANFWQDIGVDREKNRIYIPLDLLRKHDFTDENILQTSSKIICDSLLKELGDFTFSFFKQGALLPLQVKGRLSWELRCTWLGGVKILEKACGTPGRSLIDRPEIRVQDKLSILWKSFFKFPPLKVRGGQGAL